MIKDALNELDDGFTVDIDIKGSTYKVFIRSLQLSYLPKLISLRNKIFSSTLVAGKSSEELLTDLLNRMDEKVVNDGLYLLGKSEMFEVDGDVKKPLDPITKQKLTLKYFDNLLFGMIRANLTVDEVTEETHKGLDTILKAQQTVNENTQV